MKEKKVNQTKNYETIVGSVEEALNLAKQWRQLGKFDLFRGQGRNWEIQCSIHRSKSQKKYNLNLERLEILYYFMETNEVLKEYIENQDYFVAIAQHYGVATNFIDFTTDPEIAAYFATHSSGNRLGEYACIICANKSEFADVVSFAKPIIDKYLVNGHIPEFLSFDVKNLWRLQAQKGLFLYTPFSGIEHIYKFDRILFPFSKPFVGIDDEDIYPIEKSALESNLDHFFTAERRSNNMKRVQKWLDHERRREIPKHNMFDYIDSKYKPHHSWTGTNTLPWHQRMEENWTDIKRKERLKFCFSYSKIRNMDAKALASLIEDVLNIQWSSRSLITKIVVERFHIPFNKKLDQNIQRGCNLIWNGMRGYPFTNGEIAAAIARFVIIMSLYRPSENYNNYMPLLGQVVYIAISNEDGSHSKAYISGVNILQSKRKNIYRYINNEHRATCLDNPVALTQLITAPNYLFSFENFRQLFVLDAIPTQTLLAISDENPVIYFNPIHIKVFGLA